MRFRPANIRVINRRDRRFGHSRGCVADDIDNDRKERADEQDPGVTNELV
jgi:hypothetical protein